MYAQHFSLSVEPFSDTFDPRFFYRGFQHSAALGFLEKALTGNQSTLALSGDAGSGKSASLRYFLNERRNRVRMGKLDRLTDDPDVFLTDVLSAFGFGAVEAKHAELRNLLCVFLVQVRQDRQKAILQIHEPTTVEPEVLDELLWLAETGSPGGTLKIIMTGGEGLDQMLSSPRLALLSETVQKRHQLDPLTARETHDYVQFRLKTAGCERPEAVVTAEAGTAIHVATGGIPRLINRLTSRSMEYAANQDQSTVSGEVVCEAASQIGLKAPSPKPDERCRLDVFMAATPFLEVPLGTSKMLVGRHASNDICLRDGSVSRHHAAIVPEENGWLIIDLNSTNGLRLNGEVVRQAYLSDSDEVTVGRFRMVYRGRGIDVGQTHSTDLRRTVVLNSDQKKAG
jgi:general secretion pathway protein A